MSSRTSSFRPVFRSSRWCTMLTAALAVTVLGACAGSEVDQIQSWMNEQRSIIKPRVMPLGESKVFVPQPYTGKEDELDPFNLQRLTQVLFREAGLAGGGSSVGTALLAVEQNRRREELESYPLDAMVMVGSMRQNGVDTALLQVNDLLYSVRVGNHLGQSYGRIVGITENSVILRELIQEPGGDWVEKETVIQLKEEGQR